MTNEARELARRIQDFIAPAGSELVPSGDDAFNELARAVFAYQYERNAPYRRFCDGRKITPAQVTTWRDIPAAPASAFKRFALTCAPEADCAIENGGRVFHSSGTTGSETSRHFLDAPALDVYGASLRDGFHRFVLPDLPSPSGMPIFALMPPPKDAPHSSLSFMLGELVADFGGGFFVGDGWQTRLADQLRNLAAPICVFGTAFAWVHFFDAVSERFTLPAGSRIVETGGFKGRSREVSPDELYALFTERLNVPPAFCVSEYGMSEMASQFYDSALQDNVRRLSRPRRKLAAPTIRTRIMNPVTAQEAEPGTPGLLAHCDIANLNSVLALQTEDMGQSAPDNDGFILLGRAPGAVLRGCSLTAEELHG